MKKIDIIARKAEMVKTASLGKEIMSHKDETWFYPAIGGASAALLASPEIIQDLRDDKTPQALRRLILSGGAGAGLGFVGGKVLKGESSDLRKMLDALKSKIGEVSS